ncbi:MAG: FAD-binding oxidoreductase [Phycisphaerae bacterium]|nr:FAD-binding oxidoreductase [Saprospiraceae bacterium]
MKKVLQSMAGWANYPRLQAEVFEPNDRVGVRSVVLDNDRIIARGNGKSYGDAALALKLLSTLRLNRVLAFDAENGIVECEAGVLLSDLLKIIVPKGWFFHVTPGTKAITVGGAIASDVHGKNHPTAGCFSNHLISFDLMTASGEIKSCSRSENTDLFWQTCGGMGWTGVVLSAKFNLLKITSSLMRQKSVKAKNLEEIFRAFKENRDWPYAAAWVDCTNADWRGWVLFATHEDAGEKENPPVFFEASKRNVPFFAPSWFLNRISIWVNNYFYFNKKRAEEERVTLDKYFYPLDALQNWNRFYGRRGFVQYQFCLPEENAFDGVRQMLETIRQSKETPFLTVLKCHGERPPEAVHSFPIRGYSLALDFPRTSGIFELVKKLDTLVWELDGKIYLTKDACSAPQMGRVNPAGFGEKKFTSLLRERITLGG